MGGEGGRLRHLQPAALSGQGRILPPRYGDFDVGHACRNRPEVAVPTVPCDLVASVTRGSNIDREHVATLLEDSAVLFYFRLVQPLSLLSTYQNRGKGHPHTAAYLAIGPTGIASGSGAVSGVATVTRWPHLARR